MSKSDAMRFPLMGSVVLLGLFTAIKFLPKVGEDDDRNPFPQTSL